MFQNENCLLLHSFVETHLEPCVLESAAFSLSDLGVFKLTCHIFCIFSCGCEAKPNKK